MVQCAAMAARVLALLVFLLIAAVAFWYALVTTVHHGAMAVPDLAGTTVEDARNLAHDLGMELEVEDPGVFSTEVPAGTIATQRPHPGYQVKPGARVTVRVSLGSERVAIPKVYGESLQSALRGLESVGLTPGARCSVVGHAGPDQVIATAPPMTSEVSPAGRVDLLVNTAPRDTVWVMPSLLSHQVDDIRRFCSRHGLRLGQVHEVTYPGVRSGLVLRQYPPAGSPASRSDIISLWVSR
jgi:serine/threonine-protein kinase